MGLKFNPFKWGKNADIIALEKEITKLKNEIDLLKANKAITNTANIAFKNEDNTFTGDINIDGTALSIMNEGALWLYSSNLIITEQQGAQQLPAIIFKPKTMHNNNLIIVEDLKPAGGGNEEVIRLRLMGNDGLIAWENGRRNQNFNKIKINQQEFNK